MNELAVKTILSGELPFREDGATEVLQRVLAAGRLEATVDPSVVGRGEHIVVVIGTPVDEHLNPDPHAVPRALAECQQHFRPGQLLVLRSTVYPGVTRRVEMLLAAEGIDIDVAFCPERIAEGKAMQELFTLPQIVSARSPRVLARAGALFGSLTDSIVELSPEEAELAKLFTNTWRYIKFAAANQFYVMANDQGLDFDRIRTALAYDYPRAADMPGAGFAAGPCLFKDTMQLAAFTDNSFILGHSAMLVNEGCRSTWSRGWRPGTTWRTCGSAFWAWRSRARVTTSGRACPTSSSESWNSGPSRCCAPIPTSASMPTSNHWTTCWPMSTC